VTAKDDDVWNNKAENPRSFVLSPVASGNKLLTNLNAQGEKRDYCTYEHIAPDPEFSEGAFDGAPAVTPKTEPPKFFIFGHSHLLPPFP
jgi:hypothetical protein